MSLPHSTDVLIVGAGPVGMALANLLGRHGVETLIIDKTEQIQTAPRAIALDNEALRILQLAGLDEAAFARVVIPEARLHSPIFGEFARINATGMLDGHPRLVTFFQPELEHALETAIDRFACLDLRRRVECGAVSQTGDGCKATLRDADGVERTVAARYIVAADGASSPIRRQLGIAFDGTSHEENWLIVDAVNAPKPIDHVEFLCDPRRPVPHMPAPGNRQRWEFMLHPGEPPEEMLRPERVRELLLPWMDYDEATVERTAVYRFHARTVRRFSAGRVFLVGDAAHVTPPFAGQGLVAGLRDVANLAWKLAWVVNGKAGEKILDSYHTERQPHARAMIRLAQLMGKLIMPRSRLAAFLGHGIARTITLTPGLRGLILDLKIKPRNRFAQGLFAAGKSRAGFERGGHLPQAELRTAEGSGCLSDDALGPRLLILGLGVEPREHLSPAALAQWQALGGDTLRIDRDAESGAASVRDASGSFFAVPRERAWLVVVRPDKVIIVDGPPAEADRLVETTCALLR